MQCDGRCCISLSLGLLSSELAPSKSFVLLLTVVDNDALDPPQDGRLSFVRCLGSHQYSADTLDPAIIRQRFDLPY